MFKITSRFYVIYGDDEPIYVGYTNRTVQQRFSEHKQDKDFTDYEELRVQELKEQRLSYPFTWDYEHTCKNAEEVSNREQELVKVYGTQSSEYQKADGGGQTWASEKSFIKSSKGNPKYDGMSPEEVQRYLKNQKVLEVWISNFVGSMRPQFEIDIHNFVGSMRPQFEIDIHNFVGNMKPQFEVDISNFVQNMRPQFEADISNFVHDMRPQFELDISNFVSHMRPQFEVDISSFMSSMRPQFEVDISNFVKNMKLTSKNKGVFWND